MCGRGACPVCARCGSMSCLCALLEHVLSVRAAGACLVCARCWSMSCLCALLRGHNKQGTLAHASVCSVPGCAGACCCQHASICQHTPAHAAPAARDGAWAACVLLRGVSKVADSKMLACRPACVLWGSVEAASKEVVCATPCYGPGLVATPPPPGLLFVCYSVCYSATRQAKGTAAAVRDL